MASSILLLWFLALMGLCWIHAIEGASYKDKLKELEIDEEFSKVTCGSVIKLTHESDGFKLHSHKIPYGSGSGQQSVTAFPNADDTNSNWLIKAAHGKSCKRGDSLACGSIIRLYHIETKKYLHSHLHQSPLSNNQEVSAYEGENEGDNWKVECKTGEKEWMREAPVDLIHMETGKRLMASSAHAYRAPIPGQLEVSCVKNSNKNTRWFAGEGVYFSSTV